METKFVKLASVINDLKVGCIAEKCMDEPDNKDAMSCEYLRPVNISDGMIMSDCIEFKVDNSSEYIIEDDDILLTRTGLKQIVICVQDTGNRKICVGNSFYRIRVDKKIINPMYLTAWLNSLEGRENLNEMYTGQVMPILTIANLKQIEIPLPAMSEQNAIAERYVEKQKKIRQLKSEIHQLYIDIENMT